MQNRRDFIRQSATACSALAGFGFLATHLESCKAPAAAITSAHDAGSNKITIPLSSFGTQNKMVVEGPNGEYKIFLLKKSESEIEALQLKCTHRGHDLDLEGTKLHCPLHGSEFDFDGNVTEGPAASPLKKFPVAVQNGNAVISTG